MFSSTLVLVIVLQAASPGRETWVVRRGSVGAVAIGATAESVYNPLTR